MSFSLDSTILVAILGVAARAVWLIANIDSKLETVVQKQAVHDKRLNKHEARLDDHEKRIDTIEKT